MAPTTSFWDCGEFIAASYNLSVPHPPGTPLYLMVGRLFSLLPIAENIGMRVNLISSLVSAITILLLYLSIVRLARIWRGPEIAASDKFAVYGSAAVGALCFAFTHSFWWNAVEAEVYAGSMFLTALVFYLALRWLDVSDKPEGSRLLLMIFYITGLSTGVHLLNVLALIPIALIVTFKKFGGGLKVFLIGGLVGSAVLLAIYPVLVQGMPMMLAAMPWWLVVLILAGLVYLAIHLAKRDRRIPAFSLIALLLVLLGYSTFLLIKIRSGLDPFLDENDPETWSRLVSYLNREQYGTESLFLTMFNRKAPFWTYQIDKMYLRYFGWQYIDFARFLAIPFLLGVIGVFHHFARDSKNAMVVLSLFLMTGLAIVLYLNQDDPQPRERDYAYVGSFFAFAIWIGLGVLALIETLGPKIKKLNPAIPAGGIAGLCLVAAPLNMFSQNLFDHSRRGNYVAWDYSYNLLQTCAPNAILYTNGDNDTFPLWYLQDVEGVRTDVRVANLSLLNTGWFIKQIRDKDPKVPMPARITDQYIENTIDSREVNALLDRRWQPSRKVKVKAPDPDSPDLVWDVPSTLSYPFPGGQTEYFLRVQDMMILNTLVANNWERPIYFAVTVPDGNLLGLRNIQDTTKNFLSMEGLAFRLHTQPVPLIDAEYMAKNMLKVYRYRNTNSPDVYFNDNILRLLGNYRQGLIQLAYYWTDIAKKELGGVTSQVELEGSVEERVERWNDLSPRQKALTALGFMEQIVPDSLIPYSHEIIPLQIGRLYAELGYPEQMKHYLDALTKTGEFDAEKAYEYGFRYLAEAGSPESATELFNLSLEKNRAYENHRRIALTWLQYAADTARAADALRRYLTVDDSRQGKLRVADEALNLRLPHLSFSIYEPLLQDNPDDGEVTRGMVECYRVMGDFQRGIALADDWLARHPDDRLMQRSRESLLKTAPTAGR